MPYILLDESGDLGFNKAKSSRYFIITFLVTDEVKPMRKIIKKIGRTLSIKLKRKSGVLHSIKEKPATRKRLLKLLAEHDIRIMTIVLNKSKVHVNLQDEKAVLYNFVANILIDRLCTKKLIDKNGVVSLIASRKETNKLLNQNFSKYLEKQATSRHKIDLVVKIKTPEEEKGLQVVDFASWAIFRKYEHSDDEYYKLIADKIKEENFLYK